MSDCNRASSGHGSIRQARPVDTPAGAATDVVQLLLPVLILWNWFILVLKDNDYPLLSPEVALSLLALTVPGAFLSLIWLTKRRGYYAGAIAAFLVLFVDFMAESTMQLHKFVLVGLFILAYIAISKLGRTFYLPAVSALSVMLVTTVFLLLQQSSPEIAAFETSGPVTDEAPTRLIHLVLDEHLGIEGFPKSLPFGRIMKERVKAFYQNRGFRLHGGAYSHYCNTYDAIPDLLNFTREPTPKQFVSGEGAAYVLVQNRYFELLKARRYRLHVIGVEYLDLCAHARELTTDCQSYHLSGWRSVAALDVPIEDKTAFLLRSFVTRYQRYQRFQHFYATSWRPILAHHADYLSRLVDSTWIAAPAHTYAANAMEVIDRIWDNVVALPRGHAAFIHLMLPHFPYTFAQNCRTRPIHEWKEKMDDVPNGQRTAQLQAERYQLYFEQMDCLLTLLGNLLDRLQQTGMLEDSIILIHGDHGSRLAIRDPTADAMPLTDSDLRDYFSLLYAVKRPGEQARYDDSPAPIEDLLIDSLRLPVSVRYSGSIMPPPHFVFLWPSAGRREYLPVPYPTISPPPLQDAS